MSRMNNHLKSNFIIKLIYLVFLINLQLLISPFPVKANRVLLEQQFQTTFNQGNTFRLQGNYEKAISSFNKSLFLANKTSDKKKKLDSLINLGLIYWNIGDLKGSNEFYNQALSLSEKFDFSEKKREIQNYKEIYRLYLTGKEYRSQGEYKKSIENFNNAIRLAKKINSQEHEVKCLRQESITFWDSNDIRQFSLLNKQALKIAQNLNHKKEEGRCLNNIGLFYEYLENYSLALKNFEKALQIARELSNLEEQSNCLTNISNIYGYMGNYDKALEYMLDALRIDRQLNNDAYISIDLNNIGEIYRSQGLISKDINVFNRAIKYFNDCMKLAKKNKEKRTEIYAIINIGAVYTDLKKYSEALKYYNFGLKKADEIQDKESIGMLINNIGIVYYNQGDYQTSIKYLQKSIDLAQEINGGKILWEAYFEIANAYKKQDNFPNALQNFKNSISIIEDIRSNIKLEELKASYLGTDKRIEAYHNLIDLLVKSHQSNTEKSYDIEAFNYMERAKARSFLDSLEVSEVEISEGANLELLDQEKELMKNISDIYQKLLIPNLSKEQVKSFYYQLKAFEDKIESIKREIRISSPAYANLKYPQIIKLEEAQRKLADKETAFFEYCVGKEGSYAFVITRKKLKIFKLPPAQKIRSLVRKYIQVITDKENQDFRLGYELFSSLILPGLDKNIKKIVIAPDDILNFLPFETLITQKNSYNWLIQDFKIAYIPSLSALNEIIQHKRGKNNKSKKDFLAFGDPFFGNHENGEYLFQDYYSSSSFNFSRLKYSGLEIDGISSLFQKTKKSVYKRENATEKQVKDLDLDEYKILHFATHGLIDDKNPARSSIILSLDKNNREDGFLQMREIFNLKLNCDLVTLSACQTGLGQFVRGEGIESLNRAFFYAGASSALISLWAVNDQASAQLMERFYTHLHSSSSIMNALKKAKLELIGSGTLSHPYYWAGFIATGMADKVIFPSPLKKLTLLISALLLCGGITAYIGFNKN